MPQVSREVMPDIWVPLMMIELEAKYEMMLNENIMKVSVIGFTRRNGMCLKEKLVTKPKARPTPSDITASITNSPRMTKGVLVENDVVSMDLTVLYRMIDTMSLNTPSPNTHEYSFGCCS